jgi:hypothetical protein
MKIVIEIKNIEQIGINIAALQNAIEGKPPRPVDLAPLIGLQFMMTKIKDAYEDHMRNLAKAALLSIFQPSTINHEPSTILD